MYSVGQARPRARARLRGARRAASRPTPLQATARRFCRASGPRAPPRRRRGAGRGGGRGGARPSGSSSGSAAAAGSRLELEAAKQLIAAVKAGDAAAVRAQLDVGVPVEAVDPKDEEKPTVLMVACHAGHEEVASKYWS
eukprot:tig00021036_g17393.t1